MLQGVRVLEVAQFWYVPAGTAILADWGADVVKVEHPLHGDGQRGLITTGAAGSPFSNADFNYMWEQPNRGKRSIGIDLANPDGLELLYRLVAGADVFVTNFLPDARARLGIDVADIRKHNPDIVYVRGTGHGDRGPDRDRGGYDNSAFWARGGIAERLTPPTAGEPVLPRPAMGDSVGALGVALAVSGGLLARARGGPAPVVDVSLLATAVWVLGPDMVAAGLDPGGGIPHYGREDMTNPVNNYYRTADGRWLCLVLLQADRYWAELCEKIGRRDLLADQRFTTMEVRNANRDACRAELEATFASRTLPEWREQLATMEGVWAPMQDPTELHSDPQVVANGYLPAVDYGDRKVRLAAGPIQFDGRPPALTPAPELGQHTEEVLLEAGLDWDEIIARKESGAIT